MSYTIVTDVATATEIARAELHKRYSGDKGINASIASIIWDEHQQETSTLYSKDKFGTPYQQKYGQMKGQ